MALFSRIIVYNFVTIYGILQPNLVSGWPRRKEKKTEETQPIFEGSYLGNAWRDLVEIWNVTRGDDISTTKSFVTAGLRKQGMWAQTTLCHIKGHFSVPK